MKEMILVTGATGLQGGVVTRKLLQDGYVVRALTRHPNSPKAKELSKLGALIYQGDFNNPQSLMTAMKDVDIVYAMATPHNSNAEIEVENGITLADAAVKAGISYYIYSSVANADLKTGIPHFDSKFEIEKHIKFSEIPHTIIAPVYFMENILGPINRPSLQLGFFSQPLPANIKLQMISVNDIAEFVSYVIENRDNFLNKRINIAGDEITGLEIAEIMTNQSHQEIGYRELPLEQIKATSTDMGLMYQWFNEVGYSIDISELKLIFTTINWTTFKHWAEKQDWHFLGKHKKHAA